VAEWRITDKAESRLSVDREFSRPQGWSRTLRSWYSFDKLSPMPASASAERGIRVVFSRAAPILGAVAQGQV